MIYIYRLKFMPVDPRNHDRIESVTLSRHLATLAVVSYAENGDFKSARKIYDQGGRHFQFTSFEKLLHQYGCYEAVVLHYLTENQKSVSSNVFKSALHELKLPEFESLLNRIESGRIKVKPEMHLRILLTASNLAVAIANDNWMLTPEPHPHQ